MKVLAFAGSSSRNSINKQLVEFARAQFKEEETKILDLNDYEMPIFSIDKEKSAGIPQLAFDFSAEIEACDLLLISLAEHNGAYSAAFKNIFDWLSRIPGKTVFQNKAIFLMATSPGPRGGSSVLEIAKNRFPFNGGKVVESFSLPSFEETFHAKKGISNPTLLEEFSQKIEKIKQDFKQEL
ncbi:MAG: NAD(P)H-dependent oxidoreductase [Chitinophagales bacterium]